MLSDLNRFLSHYGNTINASHRSVELAVDDDNHIAVIVFTMFYFASTLYDTKNGDRIFSFMTRFCLCLVRAMILMCGVLLSGLALVALCTIIHIVRLDVVLSTATMIAFEVAIVILVTSIVVSLLLVVHRLLRTLVSCIRSLTSLFWWRLVGTVMLLLGISSSGLAFVWLCTVIHRVGLAMVFSMVVTITFKVAIVVLVTSIVASVVLVVHRLLRILVSCIRSLTLLFWWRLVGAVMLLLGISSSGLAFVWLCTVIHCVGLAMVFSMVVTITFKVAIVVLVTSIVASVVLVVYRLLRSLVKWATQNLTTRVCYQREPIRFGTIPKERDEKIFQVNFSPYSSVYLVEKWNPGLGQEYSDMVSRNYLEVQMEQDEVPFEVQEQEPEDQEQDVEVEVEEIVLPPAPRRSSRRRKKPDRWVPPSQSIRTLVPIGSFYGSGLRRSSRIAKRLAVQ